MGGGCVGVRSPAERTGEQALEAQSAASWDPTFGVVRVGFSPEKCPASRSVKGIDMSPASPPARRRSSMKVLAMMLSMACLLFVGVTSTQTAEAAPTKKPSLTQKVTGKTADGTAVEGTYKITKFAVEKGKLVAKGTFTGKILGSDGTDTVKKAVTIPVSQGAEDASGQDVQAQATCNVLNLSLGPLDLNLLGLVVHLDEVNLIIDAVSGPGALLGNLLCAVAGLLDGPSLPGLNDILADLLNLILGNLGG